MIKGPDTVKSDARGGGCMSGGVRTSEDSRLACAIHAGAVLWRIVMFAGRVYSGRGDRLMEWRGACGC